eukprot:6132404-Amphidinium_carterae.1
MEQETSREKHLQLKLAVSGHAMTVSGQESSADTEPIATVAADGCRYGGHCTAHCILSVLVGDIESCASVTCKMLAFS